MRKIRTRLAVRLSQRTFDETLRKSLARLGFDVVAGSPNEYTVYLHNEIERWTAVVKKSEINVAQ
ncbi:hypothetical protein ASG57_17440 [Bradyrhizobium sp. Leaf396]|nr:hypothetical protein ASG57_17440 [Bradyrhizobium sp. Leaf396]